MAFPNVGRVIRHVNVQELEDRLRGKQLSHKVLNCKDIENFGRFGLQYLV